MQPFRNAANTFQSKRSSHIQGRPTTGAGYTGLDQLAAIGEVEIARLHGIGPQALTHLRQALAAHGLSFAADRAKGG